MFRKLVSSLPFSPALVGQLGFYARRLRKEEITRRLGLIFTVLAVIMQSFTVFSAPEQALADSNSNVVSTGIYSIQQALDIYDAGSNGQNDFKDLMNYIGITRDEIGAMNQNVQYICSSDQSWISFGRQHHYSSAEGELVHTIPLAAGGSSTFYSVPLYRFDSVNNHINCYDSYIGWSAKAGTFSIMRKCGNIQVTENVQKFPKGHFVTASCKAIKGYAYDERQENLPVTVYLYLDGPPGKGKQFGPLTANQADPSSPISGSHGFSFDVPEEYQKIGHTTTVWASLVPLAGWSQPMVQFDNTVEIPGNCTPPEVASASCSLLSLIQIDRTRIRLDATAATQHGATISSYTFKIVDKSSNKVYEKTISSTLAKLSSETIDLSNDGEYLASVVVKTSVGDKTSADCAAPFKISPPNKCKFIGASDLNIDDANCKPCPYNDKIWIKNNDCAPKINEFKEAKNLTKNKDATSAAAAPSDRIEYTVYTTNAGDIALTTSVNESIADILDYSRLIDAGGGTFDSNTKILSWNDVKLDAQKTDVRKFIVQLLDVIPATSQGGNNAAAFNCVMTNSYGKTIEIKVECPLVKGVETTVKAIPSTGPGENVMFATIVLMVVTYLYARSRQMRKEVQVIRGDF